MSKKTSKKNAPEGILLSVEESKFGAKQNSGEVPQPNQVKAHISNTSLLSSAAHELAAIGLRTEQVVQKFSSDNSLFLKNKELGLTQLAKDIKSVKWEDQNAAQIIEAFAESINAGRELNLSAVSRWVLSHPNDAKAVKACLAIDPPEEITIIRLESTAGSQKEVFLATWQLTQKEVIFKNITGDASVQKSISERESQSHPLSMRHPNIVETHFLRNAKGTRFLVEERLPFVLHDKWLCDGIHEAANLLYDVGNALVYLHSRGFVHGDIKPDNIGKKVEDYILLDFGICRPTKEFTPEVTATGSLRTRAPELLTENRYDYPEKADVWSLGATIFGAVAGRYPLFEKGEKPPRLSAGAPRQEFEVLLKERIIKSYDKYVNYEKIHEQLRPILQSALNADPAQRPTAAALVKEAEKQLGAFLRTHDRPSHISPLDEIKSLAKHLPKDGSLKCMPITQREALRTRLEELRTTPGVDAETVKEIVVIMAQLI